MQEITNILIEIQKLAYVIIKAAHEQNYDKEMRSLIAMSSWFSNLFKNILKLDGIVDVRNFEDIFSQAIVKINEAQSLNDYVLIADLIELDLLPVLMELVAVVRDNMDITICEQNWEHNITELKKIDLKLADNLEAKKEKWLREDNPKYEIELTNSGLFTLAGNSSEGKYYYHSNNNPENEAYDFANHYYSEEYEKYIVYGLGLGYHVKALVTQDETIFVTIFENDLEILMHAMMANNLDWIWKNNRVELVVDSTFSRLSEVIKNSGNETGFVVHFPSLRHVGSKKIEEKLNQLFIKDSSYKNQANNMRRNFRENIKVVDKCVDELKDLFKGKKVVIVAAGPSLDCNIDLLKNSSDDVMILATGTVFRKLVNLGVRIDYVIITDANRRVISQIKGLEHQTIPMILISTAYRGFAREYVGDKYLIYQKDFDYAEIVAEQNGFKLYETGGSVSTTALDLCLKFGCKSLAFVGLDLAYTDNLAHAMGSSRRVANDIEDLPKVKGYRFEYTSENQVRNDEIIAGKYKIKMETVISSHLFDIYRSWIEKRLSRTDYTTKVYNASEVGSWIDHMKYISLAEFLLS